MVREPCRMEWEACRITSQILPRHQAYEVQARQWQSKNSTNSNRLWHRGGNSSGLQVAVWKLITCEDSITDFSSKPPLNCTWLGLPNSHDTPNLPILPFKVHLSECPRGCVPESGVETEWDSAGSKWVPLQSVTYTELIHALTLNDCCCEIDARISSWSVNRTW